MNDFDDFGGSLANSDFQKENAYYNKQSNLNKALSKYTAENTISGGMAVTIFKNIKDDRFSVEEKLDAVGFVLSMPTYNSIYKDDFRDAVEWLYSMVVADRLNNKAALDLSIDLSGFPIGNF